MFLFLIILTNFVIAIPEAPPQLQEPQVDTIDAYEKENASIFTNSTYIFFWIVALVIIGLLLSFVFLIKKEKVALTIVSLASLTGIIILASMIYLTVSQILSIGYIADTDSLVNLWFLIPTIFMSYLSYKLWGDSLFYKKQKLTFGFLTWGIILTIILSMVLFLIIAPISDGDGLILLLPIIILFWGSLITFILSAIGFIIDKVKSKK